jgi:hypothetical protein
MAGPDVVRNMGETLVALLQAVLSGIVAPAKVQIATQDSFHDLEPTPQPTSTTFLYRVAVNSVMRNGPRVALGGGATSRPLLPVDLSYLIRPWAKDPPDEHLILGTIMQGLYDRAELGAADLTGTSWAPDDTVKLVLETLTLQEHFCIWDTIDMPHRLSLTNMTRITGIAPVVRSIFQAGVP